MLSKKAGLQEAVSHRNDVNDIRHVTYRLAKGSLR